MYIRPPILLDLLHLCEIIALTFAVFNNKYFKHYLLYIVLLENFGETIFNLFKIDSQFIQSLFSIPIEFLFFIWLFAMKSLKNKKLYIISTVVYLLSFIPELSIEKGKFFFNSFNYLIGGFILLFLVLLELNNQIKSDDILRFKENKMFYITIGIALFYVGNLPFFGLYYLILKEPEIWNIYYIYFMVSNCLMYLLFAASFIWGKPKS